MTADEVDLLNRITVIEGLMGGKPTIRGMRFPVADLLGYLSAGMTKEELLREFPFLQEADISAALYYAAQKLDHPVIKVAPHAA